MRQFLPLLLLVLAAIPAGAARRATIAQLEQTVNVAIAAHKSDEDTARHIVDLELTERLTAASLDRLLKQLMSRPKAALALQLLADQSAFLDPPPSEFPTTAAPEDADQQRMLHAARTYVAQTLQRLPNFLATRTITRYDDTPRALKKGEWGVRQGMWQVDTSRQEISVNVERESQPPAQSSAVWQGQIGLISGGEFGTTLGMIMTDSVEGKITWSHWEKAGGNPVAVFRYSVPRSASHFQVIGYREKTDLVGFGSVTRGSAPSRLGVQASDPANTTAVRTKPGYHGEFWVDPATGTVLRITLESDSKEGAPFRRAGILVQYGPVEIGDSSFVCPTRGLAFSEAVPDPNALTSDSPTEWLNVTEFTGYHRFASTTRILAEVPPMQAEKHEAANETPKIASLKPDETAPMTGTTPTPPDSAPSSVPLDSPLVSSTPLSSAPTTPATVSPPPPPSTAIVAPATVSSPTVPVAEHADQPSTTGHTIEMNVNRVLVPVVVRDRNGRNVSGLKKEDFTVFDNNKERTISRFLVESRETGETVRLDNSGIRQEAQALPDQVLPSRILVFLFDDLHLSFEDLSYARKAASNALGGLDNSDMAAVVSASGKINSGLTHDPAKLLDALAALRPQGIYRTDASECPKIDYYQADLIENKHDNTALQDAITQVMKVCDPKLPADLAEAVVHTSARRTLVLGIQDVRATCSATEEFVRRIAKMPGERMLVLVSSGFLPIEQEARTLESQLIDLAANSNVTISAIDARGLYTASLTASDDMRGRMPDLVADYRRTSMKLAEEAMGELADGTGGTFFHNSNDLDAGFKKLTDGPGTVYLLELSLDKVKMDGSYHRLKVKLDRNDLDLNARRGYFTPKQERNKK